MVEPTPTRPLHIEELRHCGYTILADVFAPSLLLEARARLDSVYERQVAETGESILLQTNEENMVRCPLAYDPFFVQLATLSSAVQIAHELLGGKYVSLHLQNGIINRPQLKHQQTYWHRDLPYQEFVSSRPLAISALVCIDEFTEETGCTHVLPYSHRAETLPSDAYTTAHQRPVAAAAGSVILFDAMLFHRAGYNSSSRVRRGINHVYSVPLIRQQIEMAGMVDSREAVFQDPEVRRLLGLDTPTPRSVVEFRQQRAARLGLTLGATPSRS